ncbi:MAG: TlpA disulfide reductase family protein [Pirellulaceae bacterium]|nr:TlpA disulfide reductase family protein [Pirellulaceae bacterium]
MSAVGRKRWKHIRVFVVPAMLLLVAMGWLVLDGLRMRRSQLSKYVVPSDHSASAMLDFMRKMDGSVQFSEGYFESSNSQSISEAVRKAYGYLQLEAQSLTEAEKHEAAFYNIYYSGASLVRSPAVTERDIDDFVQASKQFFATARDFSSREQQISSISVHVLESGGRIFEARALGKWILEQIEQRDELSSDTGKITAQNLTKVVNRLEMLHNTLELQSRTLDDLPFDLVSLRGKVVLIEFWGTHCTPCIADFPALKRIYAEYKERGFEMVAVCMHAPPARVKNFITEYQLPWIQLCDDKTVSGECNKRLSDRFGIEAVPTTLLIDQEGRVAALGVRPLAGDPERDLEQWIKKLLSK